MRFKICSALTTLLLLVLIGLPAIAASAREKGEDTAPAGMASADDAKEDGKADKAEDAKPAEESAQSVSTAEKPSDEKPAEEKSAKKKPETEKPVASKPAVEKKPAGKPNGEKPETHKVVREPLVVKLSLDGVFEAQRMHELVLRPEVWSSYKVVTAAEHGERVDKGQVVVRFEPDDIDQAIADLKRDLALNTLTLKVTELELHTLERLAPVNLAAVQRQRDQTEEDRRYYLKTEGPLSRRTADVILEQSRQTLEYQQEELTQLEKMYKADELTEETEEIVLRRARNAVERAKFLLDRTEIFHQRTTEIDLPRQETSMQESADRAILAGKLLQETLPLRLEQARLEAEKAKVVRERSEQRLAELEMDHKLMTLAAPAEGVVYYGRCVDGKWRRGSSAESLRSNGSISANDVFMTIVDPRPLVVRASVPEKHLADVPRGLQGTATPAGFPELKLSARLERIDRVPNADTEFDAIFRVSLNLEAEPLMPGMTCKMEFTPYRQRRALTVPPKAVFADDWDVNKQYVWLYREGAKPRRQTVILGRKTDEKAEILEGIEAGDEILLKAPEDAAKK